MLKIERKCSGTVTVLTLIGRVEAEHILAIRTQIGTSLAQIALDLSEVTIVNLEVVHFLGECEASGIELRNCPTYIRYWSDQERKDDASDDPS
jgi:hypothetical protein